VAWSDRDCPQEPAQDCENSQWNNCICEGAPKRKGV